MIVRIILTTLAGFLVSGCSTSPRNLEAEAFATFASDFAPSKGSARHAVLAEKVIYSFGNYATGIGRGRTKASMHRRIIVRGKPYFGTVAKQAQINFVPKLEPNHVPRMTGDTIYIEMLDSEYASVVALLSKPKALVAYLDRSSRGSVRGEIIVIEEP